MQEQLRYALGLALVLAVGLVGCDDATGPDTGGAQLSVQLTDAPSDYFASATVEIGAVEIIPDDGPPVMLTEDAGEHDLLELQNGVTREIASLDIEPGTYLQLRLIVEGASVELAEGLEFNDGTTSKDLFVPSGAQTGIKINLRATDGNGEEAGVEIVQGETILVVDFDVSQNFVIQGNPDTPAGIQDVLFTPLLRAVVMDVAGSISGSVTSASDGTGLEGLTVQAELQDSPVQEELETEMATATTDADGAYTIRFLSPGTYSVSVQDFEATSESPLSVTVGEAEDVDGVDFEGDPVPSDSDS